MSPAASFFIEQINETGNIVQHDAFTITSSFQLTITGQVVLQHNTVELVIFIAFLPEVLLRTDQEMSLWLDFIEIKVDLNIDSTPS